MTDQPSPTSHAEQSIEKLRQRLSEAEIQRSEAIDGKRMSDADASLMACRQSLEAIARFSIDLSLDGRSIAQLLSELLNIESGRKPSAMLAYRNRRGRPPENVLVDHYKGLLAAIIEYIQGKGRKRSEAIVWLTSHLPARMKRVLGSPSPKTIEGWLTRSRSHDDANALIREGYLKMQSFLKAREPTEPALQAWLRRLQDFLPSPEGWPPPPSESR